MNTLYEKKDSKIISFLLIVYLSSIMIFSFSEDLLIYSQMTFILTFGSIILFLMLNKPSTRLDKFLALFLAFIVFCYISNVWSKNTGNTNSMVFTLLQLFLMSFLLFAYLVYTENTEHFMMCLFISGLVSSVYIMGYYGIEGYAKLLREGERVGSEITNVNTIGLTTAYTVVIGFYYGYIKKKRFSYALIILPIILSLGSGSRKALTLMVLGIVLIILMDYRKNVSVSKFFRVLFACIALVAVVYWISTLPAFETVFDRFNAMFQTGSKQDSSTVIRKKMIEIGWLSFKKHPFTGVGIGNSSYITYEYFGLSTYLHNNFVELLTSIGIFGFLIYYAMYGYILVNLFQLSAKEKNTSALMLFVVILSRLILDYGMVSYYDKMTYIYLTVAAAEVYILKRKLREEGIEEANGCIV